VSEKQYTWHKVADNLDEVEFADNNITVVKLNGRTICLGKFQDAFFAFAFKCPHAGGLLAEGYIDALGNVVCPIHRYKYNMANGRNTSGEGYYLKHWPVQVREDGVYVGAEETGGLFGWLK
jgi:3-phenylpropionate/trans-cinnamate dioxygenase ferredoxin subunit